MFSDEKDVIVTTYKVKVEGAVDCQDASGNYKRRVRFGNWRTVNGLPFFTPT